MLPNKNPFDKEDLPAARESSNSPLINKVVDMKDTIGESSEDKAKRSVAEIAQKLVDNQIKK